MAQPTPEIIAKDKVFLDYSLRSLIAIAKQTGLIMSKAEKEDLLIAIDQVNYYSRRVNRATRAN